MSNMQLQLFADLSPDWVWSDEVSEVDLERGFTHATIMRGEVVAALSPRAGGIYADVTLGGGGHAEAILQSSDDIEVIGLDRDREALNAAGERLAPFGRRVRLVQSSFSSLREALGSLGVEKLDGLCADLGVSSPQLDQADRGMSFRREGPIDMRMDQERGETALELIGRLSEEELADLIYRYGDERRSRRIARSVKRALDDSELETTLDLRRAIVRAVGPARVGGVDPATRTFQALRMAVNHEMEELETLLSELPDLIVEGGVVAVLSFHSLEDRLVKRAFQNKETWAPLFKKPLSPTDAEISENPRARSAKLRAARRTGDGVPGSVRGTRE